MNEPPIARSSCADVESRAIKRVSERTNGCTAAVTGLSSATLTAAGLSVIIIVPQFGNATLTAALNVYCKVQTLALHGRRDMFTALVQILIQTEMIMAGVQEVW